MNKIDTSKIENAVKDILEAIGEDPTREGLRDTPIRVAKMYSTILNGRFLDPLEHVKVFTENTNNMVVVKDIPLYSFCEHHLALFYGTISIGYIPTGKVIGLSKLIRIARVYAKRVQLQERLTDQIADTIQKLLDPLGVMVKIEAEHTCMTIRGVRTPGAKTITSAVRGVFKDASTGARQEFMEALK